MGLKDRLRRAVLLPIRPWLRGDCELYLQSSFSGLELRLNCLELNSEAVNSQALEISPVALSRVTAQSARLRLSWIGAPAIVLVLHGLQIELSPRDSDDDYWKEAMAARDARERSDRLAAIDPEGAAEHSRAKKLEEGDHSSSGFLARFLVSFLLSAVRIELNEVTIILRSRQGHEARLSASQGSFLEGTNSRFFSGSLFGSFGYMGVGARKISGKPCRVSQLRLQLKRNVSQSNTLQYAVLVMVLCVSCSFYKTSFCGLQATIPEAKFAFDSCELETLLTMVDELEGPSVRSSESGNVAPAPGCRSAKELWAWAFSKAVTMIPGRMLSQAFKAGVLRRRYSSLYGDWLEEVAWRQKTGFAPTYSDSFVQLSTSVSELEQQLPVEAVALARLIARRQRVATISQESVQSKRSNTHRVFKEKLRSFFKAAGSVYNSATAVETDSGRKTQTFSVDISQGSLLIAAFDVSKGAAVCIRLTNSSAAYRLKEDTVEKVLVLGSLQGELMGLGGDRAGDQNRGESRERWDDRVSSRFIFISSSSFQSCDGKLMQKYETSVQARHVSLKNQETVIWASKPWKTSGGNGKSETPFLAVFSEESVGRKFEEIQQGSIVMIAVGKIDIRLRYAVFSEITPLVLQLNKLQRTEQSSTSTSSSATPESSSPSNNAAVLYKQQISSLREATFSVVPDTRSQCSVVVESLRLTVLALEKEAEITSVVLDLGYLELALWPVSLNSRSDGEELKWIRQPPQLEQPVQKGYLDRDQFGNNVLAVLEGAKLATAAEDLAGPFNITLESSMHREHCSSLLDTFKSVAVAADVIVPAVNIDLHVNRAAAAVQVLSRYVNAAMAVYSQLKSTPGEASESAPLPRNAAFSVNLSATLGEIKLGLGISEVEGYLTLNKLWSSCTVSGNSSAIVSSGVQTMQLFFVNAGSSEKLFADHLLFTFNGPETPFSEDDTAEEKFYCSVEMDAGIAFVTECPLDSILAKARLYPSTTDNMRVVFSVEKHTQKAVLGIEGGFAVFETKATATLSNFIAKYVESFTASLEPVIDETIVNTKPQSRTFTGLDRSYSAPDGGQLSTGLVRSQSTPAETRQVDETPMEGIMSCMISGFSLVFAVAGTRDLEGVLLKFCARSEIAVQKYSCKITAEVTQFTVISLRSELNQHFHERQSRVPQFGLHAHGESSGRKESISSSSKGDAVSAEPSHLSYILDCLTVSSSLSRQLTRRVSAKWTDSWEGHISVTGFDVALTTYEVQMLLAIMSSLSEISFSEGGGTKKPSIPSRQTVDRLSRDSISDGTIVALKDAQEHLYLSVEDDNVSKDQFHLGGAWHYSIAGERALFMVMHHKDKPEWFSLQSLYAKDPSGAPHRVHYRPGSRQLELSSPTDSSWELWKFIPYRTSGDDDLNFYSGIFGHLVHLINQKCKQGIALVDGIPTVASYPGNAFKVELVVEPAVQERLSAVSAITSAITIPQVRFDFGSICITLLHEASRAVHLLPLIRIRLDEVQGLAQASSYKVRTIGGCTFVIEYYEAQSSSWLPIVNPVMTEVICCIRIAASALSHPKFPVSLFCRLKKVEVIVSELSLDACLFLIGVMDLAGPYTIKHSPVLANRCQIENQTGLNILVRFDREGGWREEGKVFAWQTSSYLMRHVSSRRGITPAEVSTSVAISLEKPGTGLSSAVHVSLGEPGVFAGRTRLEAFEDSRMNAPGPIVVIDVSRQSQDGIFLTVSPMVKIHNATGLVLQLRCRRPKQADGGAIVTLKDGDIIDDSMGAFDALNLEGEMKKALLSFNVGNFLLSVRPEEGTYDWSEDVKGAKAVRVSGLFEKLQYGFKKTLKSKSLESSFGSVLCKSSAGEQNAAASGLHFLIRTLRRQVPVTRLSGDQQQKRTVVAWQEQQEMLLLPTLKVFNFLTSTVHVRISSSHDPKIKPAQESSSEVVIPASGGKTFLYADLSALFLVIKVDDYDFVSQPVDVSTGHKQFQELAKKGGSIKDLEIEVTFKDSAFVATLKVYRADDGVLELVIFTKYVLRNDSQVPILCCVAKAPSRWQRRRVQNLQWPATGFTVSLLPSSSFSWFPKTNNMLMKRQEEGSQPTSLDLDSLSGSSELSLIVRTAYSLDKIQLGITVQVPSQRDSDPSHLVRLAPRYTVVNASSQSLLVCQDGLEEEENQYVTVESGDRAAVHAQQLEGTAEKKDKTSDSDELSLRFRLKQNGWRWSGRVCAASLGSFFLKLRRDGRAEDESLKFAVVHVEEEVSSLIINFRLHSREALPYRIENRLHSGSITFHQKEMTEPETLSTHNSTDYVWDDLSLPHKLIVSVSGTQACSEVNLDKVKGWKSFAASHRSKGFSLQLPFQGPFIDVDDGEQPEDLLDVGYEVFADGPTRVCRVCQKVDSTKKTYWESEMSISKCKAEFKIPTFRIHMVEPSKQRIEDLSGEELTGTSPFTPFLSAILASSSVEVFVTSEHAVCQLRVQSLGADMKWQGAPFAAMLRIHDQDRLNSSTTALHAATVLSNFSANPIQVKYASLLLQAFDLNVDEDTLMKFVPFYRTSLSTKSSSLQLYFDRFEIHPIKIVASFVPGHPRADYTSAQETFRALLHTVIKLPSVRGATVELNGVLLSHALLTFRQLVMKCVQHYSWYAMRAIYIARGSKLLPPGFSSLFDDSAASSLDVFFDPSSGSIDVQGLTLGMFNLLSRGLRKRGQGGTSRYLGDLEKTVKKAGSNIVFAVVTEISDNVLKGAETNGFDGMINGFRRGVLNVAMEPLVLQKAVIKGGSSRRIQLDRSVGTDEAYIEGYLQAMLDSLFKQDYLKVKVMEDQVILKNLPPNSMLLNEIVACVKNFLISEGLLAGEASIAAARSMRLLRGENERKVVPAIVSLSEQLLVIFAIRGLRRYTKELLHIQLSSKTGTEKSSEANKELSDEASSSSSSQAAQTQVELPKPSFKRTIGNFFISSAIAYIDGRLCRHIPNELARRIVSGFLLSFVEQ